MPDKYKNFADLSRNETQDRDFRFLLRKCKGTTAIIAPHGGGIEPGTSELADAIAGEDLSFYAFEGIKPAGNADLHITSTRFDEPTCVALVAASPKTIAIHGENSEDQIVFIGGRDADTLQHLRVSLEASGFKVETHPNLQGNDTANICNRCNGGCGVQLELSKGLRASFFQSLTRNGRQATTERFSIFVAAVREAVAAS